MTLPTLLISYTADTCVFPSDFRLIVDTLASTHKQVEAIAADHYGNRAGGDHRRDRTAELINDWIRGLY